MRQAVQLLAVCLLITAEFAQSQAPSSGLKVGLSGLQSAINSLPSGGGVLDYTQQGGTVTFTTSIVVDRPVELRLGCVQIVLSNGATFRSTAPLRILGSMPACSGITAAPGRSIVTPSGTIPYLELSNLTLNGNGPGSQVLTTPDFGSGNNFSQGEYTFHDLVVQKFGATAFHFGVSTYSIVMRDITFQYNNGSIYWDKYSELDLRDLKFWYPVAGPQVQGTYSSSTVMDNIDFELDNAASLDPDMEITAPKRTQGGFITMTHIKFGAEGENAKRVKIRITSPAGSFVNRFRVSDSNFTCAVGQTAIQIDAPITYNDFNHNWFNQCGVAIADNQPVNGPLQNTSRFVENSVLTAPSGKFVTFLHGGKGFGKVQPALIEQLR